MAEKDKKVTFELKDLTYEELLNSYDEVTSFLSFLEESQVAVKGKGLGKNAMTDENLDEIIDDDESSEEEEAPAQTSSKPTSSVPEPVKASPPQPAPKEEIDTLFDSNDVDADDDDDDNQLPKMKGAS